MSWEKDVRYTDKRVDDGWKENMMRGKLPSADEKTVRKSGDRSSGPKASSPVTSKSFVNLVSSLGYQVMVHLGEIPDPAGQTAQPNLEASKEMIELLTALKVKTEGNLSGEENRLMTNLLADLQLKFSQKV
jgi:hypothetical protein